MFSGIIEKLARIQSVSQRQKSLALIVDTGFEDLEVGESVALNGVCLTVETSTRSGVSTFFVSAETIARSNLGMLRAQSLVNLERAVRLVTRLSGHLVQGHVDGRAELVGVSNAGEARCLEFILPDALGRYCIEKGSIALDGISLTVNAVKPIAGGHHSIKVTIIPHTWTRTNLQAVSVGDEVNVEVDAIAKYVESLCQPYLKP
jgi:riboflavin synthase